MMMGIIVMMKRKRPFIALEVVIMLMTLQVVTIKKKKKKKSTHDNYCRKWVVVVVYDRNIPFSIITTCSHTNILISARI